MAERHLFVPTPDPDRAMFSKDQWGQEAFGFTYTPKPYITSTCIRAPEGMVVLLRCEKCGGRREMLLDSRASGSALQADLMAVVTQKIKPESEGFVEEHRDCDAHPLPHELPGAVHRLIGHARQFIATHLAESSDPHVPAHFVFLFGKNQGMIAPVVGLPDYGDARTAYWAALQGGLRDHFRAIGLTPAAALYVAEAWKAVTMGDTVGRGPVDHPDRQEIVVLHALTPTYARAGTLPIIRAVPGDEDSPGTLGEMEWFGEYYESRVTDGIFALTDTLPQDDETRLRALGLPILDLGEAE